METYTNYITGNEYQGQNHNSLIEFTDIMNFTDYRFLTFLQAKKIGRIVKKGEKGLRLYRPVAKKIENKKTGKTEFKNVRKHFFVFNIEQTREA